MGRFFVVGRRPGALGIGAMVRVGGVMNGVSVEVMGCDGCIWTGVVAMCGQGTSRKCSSDNADLLQGVDCIALNGRIVLPVD